MTTNFGEPREDHATHRDRFIAHAFEELDKGDRLQASEKGWGAAAHEIKRIAQGHGWKHGSHRDLSDVAARLAQETQDNRLRLLYDAATRLHQNFYEDFLDTEEIRYRLGFMEELLTSLKRLSPPGSSKQ